MLEGILIAIGGAFFIVGIIERASSYYSPPVKPPEQPQPEVNFEDIS